uniref:1-phosphatidylinositol 4-kinase n=2 Tax=Noccaea caerulescens TaxID=107243 RepID=A0A1J3EB49_NOCCA
MSRNLDSPVQTQMAVAVFKTPLTGANKMEGKQHKHHHHHHHHHHQLQRQSSGRRVFVQTETGCVLGMELDRSDNVHTVKRRLQIALNFPTEESSLTYGDMVLTNDLSAVRNDSPLLLKRNFMHRSSSTPCLSPTGRDLQQKDRSGPIEILGQSEDCFLIVKQMVKDIVKAMKVGVEPLPVHSGLGGAYYFRNKKGESVAIVKPTDEEPFAPNNPKGFVGKALGQPGLKSSVRVGETGFREVAAYLLDYGRFANVPPTALVKITHSVFNVNDGVKGNKPREKKLVSKIASFQKFVAHDFDASDHGTSSFPVASVHRIGILDIRILNTDRHGGNLLVKKPDGVGTFGEVELIPIDHGLCLPETLEDPYFEWIHWPQASLPFSDEELDYIQKLDPLKDCDMLRRELPMIRDACLRVLVLCTVFLKEAASYGLCLAEIGEMMTREFHPGEEEPSELEVVCIEAKRSITERDVFSPRSDVVGEAEFQFDLDCDELESVYGSKIQLTDDYFTKNPFSNGRSSLGKLEESIKEEEEDDEEEEDNGSENAVPTIIMKDGFFSSAAFLDKSTSLSKLSTSMKNTHLSDTTRKNPPKPLTRGKSENTSSGHKSANEQIPASASFVKVADMKEDEWVLFLERFQELLGPAFAKRKTATLSKRQRLGTSCQF